MAHLEEIQITLRPGYGSSYGIERVGMVSLGHSLKANVMPHDARRLRAMKMFDVQPEVQDSAVRKAIADDEKKAFDVEKARLAKVTDDERKAAEKARKAAAKKGDS